MLVLGVNETSVTSRLLIGSIAAIIHAVAILIIGHADSRRAAEKLVAPAHALVIILRIRGAHRQTHILAFVFIREIRTFRLEIADVIIQQTLPSGTSHSALASGHEIIAVVSDPHRRNDPLNAAFNDVVQECIEDVGGSFFDVEFAIGIAGVIKTHGVISSVLIGTNQSPGPLVQTFVRRGALSSANFVVLIAFVVANVDDGRGQGVVEDALHQSGEVTLLISGDPRRRRNADSIDVVVQPEGLDEQAQCDIRARNRMETVHFSQLFERRQRESVPVIAASGDEDVIGDRAVGEAIRVAQNPTGMN